MRRVLPFFLFFAILTYPLLAQRGGHGGGGGGMRGGGSIGMHGGGFRGGGSIGGHAGGGFNGFRGGFNRFGGGFHRGPVFRNNFGFRRFNNFFYPGFYGYGYYPFWYDPFWDSDYGYSNPYGYASYPYASYASNYGYSGGGQAPVVIVNEPYQYPAAEPPAPVVREYVNPAPAAGPRAEQKYEEPLYLIAFKDGNIKAVAAYWVQGTVLHYVTLEHAQKESPLTSVDRDLSNRLNHERNVTFQLPARG